MDCKLLTCLAALCGLVIASAGSAAAASSLPQDLSAASVYVYFRIADEDGYAGLSPDLFAAQLDEMAGKTPAYTVLSLDEILRRQAGGQALPRRTIALTFERIDRDFLTSVVPRLLDLEFPFAIFISPGQIDAGSPGDPTWDELRSLADKGVTIGLSAYDFRQIANQDIEHLTADLNRAKTRYREEFGREADFFSYPHGLTTPSYVSLVSKQGFRAAFGQQSGVTSAGADPFTLPRFTMTNEFGDVDRFRMTAQALPFPVTDVEPDSPIVAEKLVAPGFTAPASMKPNELKNMTCFASGIGTIPILLLGNNRVELRPDKGFEDDRGRINCTLPVSAPEDSRDIRWRWLGFLFSIPGNEKGGSSDDGDFPSPEQP